MNLDLFKEALDELGIGYRESGVSLAVESCPECGGSAYKVLFRVHGIDEDDKQFMGRCQRGSCRKGFSSGSYLYKSGLSQARIRQVHGIDPDSNLRRMAPGASTSTLTEQMVSATPISQVDAPDQLDLSTFYPVWSIPDHPAAEYAVKRGYVREFDDIIKVDHQANAVVFLVNNGNKTIGYQLRYLRPIHKNMKAKTSAGFSKSSKVLEFPRAGADILVCEGPFTALSAWHYGYYGVCTFGSSISQSQVNQIYELSKKTGTKIGFALENDDAGRKAYLSLRSALSQKGIDVFKVLPEVGNDLNDSWQAGKGCVRITEDELADPAIPYIDTLLF